MNPKYAPLFTPYTFNNGVEIKNRLTVAPLTIYDSGEDGEMIEAGRRFWKNRFEGCYTLCLLLMFTQAELALKAQILFMNVICLHYVNMQILPMLKVQKQWYKLLIQAVVRTLQ